MRQFPMSLSGAVRMATAVAVLLLLGLPALVWGVLPGIRLGSGVDPARWASLLAPVVAFAGWAISPSALEIRGGDLLVLRRAWRSASFPLAGVREVAILPAGALRGAIRTFGVGGLFGYHGWFYKKGPFRLYATRSDRLVEVVIGGRRIVVSPDHPARLVEGLLAAAPRAVLRQPGEPGATSARARS